MLLRTTNESDGADKMKSFYLPWQDGIDGFAKGQRLGKVIASKLGIGATFVVASKNHLPDYLKRETVVTPRSGGGLFGDLAVLLYPDLRMATRFLGRRDSPVFVVDFHGNKLESWARVSGALNVIPGEPMKDERPAEVSSIHNHIVDIGYNGLFSPPCADVIDKLLRDLARLGWLDDRGVDYLVGALVETRDDDDLNRLRKRAAKILSQG